MPWLPSPDVRTSLPQPLDVAYTIKDPDKITSAKVEVYARELGVMAREGVPIQASGKVRFIMRRRLSRAKRRS